jgi:putative membrane protein
MEDDRGKPTGTPQRHVVTAGIVIALVLVLLFGGGMMMGPGMMLGGPLLLIGGVALVIWLARGGQLSNVMSTWNGGGGDRALDILRERYARGEITLEQYEQMRRELS